MITCVYVVFQCINSSVYDDGICLFKTYVWSFEVDCVYTGLRVQALCIYLEGVGKTNTIVDRKLKVLKTTWMHTSYDCIVIMNKDFLINHSLTRNISWHVSIWFNWVTHDADHVEITFDPGCVFTQGSFLVKTSKIISFIT